VYFILFGAFGSFLSNLEVRYVVVEIVGLVFGLVIPLLMVIGLTKYRATLATSLPQPNPPVYAQTNVPSVQTTAQVLRFCPNCGRQIETNAKFCQFCGWHAQ
jgi:hypothetical protein